MRIFLAISLAVTLGSASVARGQESTVSRLQAIAAKSQSAKTAEDYSSVISACDEVLTEESLSDKHRNYLGSLKSWAHNRRGDVRLELYYEFERVENQAQAKQALSKAMEDLQQAIKHDNKRWRAYLNRGVVESLNGNYEDAIKDFCTVIELNPDAAVAWFNRAELKYQAGDYQKALDDYEQTLRLSPGDLQAINGRGHTLFQLGETEKAMQDYETIIKMKPGSAWALANRGDLHQALGNWEQAHRDYHQALEFDAVGGVYRRLAWMLATCPNQEYLQPPVALACIQKAIDLDGETAENLDTLAAALASSGDFAAALAAQSKAISKNQSDAESMKVRKAMYEKNQIYLQQTVRR